MVSFPTQAGPVLSPVVYGTWHLLGNLEASTPASLSSRLNIAADAGVTTLDTAEVYGQYEVQAYIGAALRASPGLRDRLQIVTKAGVYVPGPKIPQRKVAHYDATATQLIRAAEESLRCLGTDRLDVLLVHRPDWLTPADETAAGLERLIQDGKIVAAGVSNYSCAQFELLQSRMRIPIFTNQIELSLFHMEPLFDGTLAQCERLRVRPMAWSPLGSGRLFRHHDPVSERVRSACEAIAPRYGNAPPEILALAWLLALPARPHPIIGTNKPERIELAAKAIEIQLERSDWFFMWEAAQGRRIP